MLFGRSRFEVYMICGLIVVVGSLLGVVFIMYRFMRNDQARWKQVTTEILKQRANVDQAMSQIRKLEEEQKINDHDLVEEIKRMVVNKVHQEHLVKKPVQVETIRAQPVILSEHDMDEALREELLELNQTDSQEEGRVVDQTV